MSDDTVASLVLELTAKVDSVQAALTSVTSQLRGVSDEANKTEAEVQSGFATMGKAAEGARETIGRFTEAILGAMAIRFSIEGLVDFTKNALDAGDQVVELSQKLGLSTDQIQALGYVATQSGSNLDAVTSSMGFMNRVLGEAATGNVTASRAFTQLHLSIQDLLAEDPEARFMSVASAINSLGSDAEKSKASSDTLGRGYKDLGNIMHLSAGQMQEMINQALKSGDIASPDVLDRIHKLSLEYDDVKQHMVVLVQEGFVGLYNNANLVEGAFAVLTAFIGSKLVPSLITSVGASISAAIASSQQAAALVAETEAMNAAASATGNLTRMEVALAAAEEAAAGSIAENTIFVGASGEAAVAAAGGMATFAAGARGAGAALLGAFGGPVGLAITATLTALALHTNQATSAQKTYNEQIADFSSKAAEMATANAKRRQDIENDSNAIIAADIRELESLDTLIDAYAQADKHTGFGSSILNGLGDLGLAGKEVAGKLGLGQAPTEVMAQADELEKAIAKLKAILATPLAPANDNSLQQYNDKVAKAAAQFDKTIDDMQLAAEQAFEKSTSDDKITDALNDVNVAVEKAAASYYLATGNIKEYSQAEKDTIQNTRDLAVGAASWSILQTAINDTRTPLEAYNHDIAQLQEALTTIQALQSKPDGLGIDPAKLAQGEVAVQRQMDLMTDSLNKYKDLFTSISSEIPADFDKMFEDLESSSTRNWKSITSIFLDTFKEMLAKMATLALAEPIIVPMVETLGSSLGISQTGITAELAKMGITGASSAASPSSAFSLAGLAGTSLLGSGALASTIDQLGAKLGIGTTVGGAAAGDAGTVVGGVSKLANFGNAAGGFVGSELGNVAFGNTGTAGTVASIAGGLGGAALATGSGAIGTAIGGALGSWAGPVGAAVGAFAAEGLTKGIMSLFGGKPSDMTEAGEASLASNTVTSTSGATSGSKFSQANSDERDSLLSFATSLSSTLASSIGTTLDNQLTVKIGSRDGSSYTIWGQAETEFDNTTDGMKSLAQSLVDLYAASGNGTAEVADLDTAIKNIDFSNATQALSDLQFAANFESLMDSLTTAAPVVSTVDTEVSTLNTTFDTYRSTADRLGLSLDKVNTAYQAQMDILQNDFLSSYQNTALNDLLPGYSDLASENASYTQSLKDAATLGLNNQQITEITLEHQLSIKSLLAQNNTASAAAISNATTLVSTYTNLSSGFASLLDELSTGDLSTASPTADLDDLRAQVESVGAQAQSGDTDAQNDLLTLIPDFLKQSASVNGYNADYAADQAMATTLAESAKSVADQQLTVQQNILNAANDQTSLLEQIAGVGTSGNANDKLVSAIKAGYTGLTDDQISAIFESAGITVTPGNGARTAALNANSATNSELNDVFHALGVPGFATGGSIGMGATGKPGVDSVPLLAMPGEFIMRARAVAALGTPTLNYMNATGRMPSNDNRSMADLGGRLDRLTDVVYAGQKMMTEHLAGIRASSTRTAANTGTM